MEDARVMRVSEEYDGLKKLDAHDEYQRNRIERLDRTEGISKCQRVCTITG